MCREVSTRFQTGEVKKKRAPVKKGPLFKLTIDVSATVMVVTTQRRRVSNMSAQSSRKNLRPFLGTSASSAFLDRLRPCPFIGEDEEQILTGLLDCDGFFNGPMGKEPDFMKKLAEFANHNTDLFREAADDTFRCRAPRFSFQQVWLVRKLLEVNRPTWHNPSATWRFNNGNVLQDSQTRDLYLVVSQEALSEQTFYGRNPPNLRTVRKQIRAHVKHGVLERVSTSHRQLFVRDLLSKRHNPKEWRLAHTYALKKEGPRSVKMYLYRICVDRLLDDFVYHPKNPYARRMLRPTRLCDTFAGQNKEASVVDQVDLVWLDPNTAWDGWDAQLQVQASLDDAFRKAGEPPCWARSVDVLAQPDEKGRRVLKKIRFKFEDSAKALSNLLAAVPQNFLSSDNPGDNLSFLQRNLAEDMHYQARLHPELGDWAAYADYSVEDGWEVYTIRLPRKFRRWVLRDLGLLRKDGFTVAKSGTLQWPNGPQGRLEVDTHPKASLYFSSPQEKAPQSNIRSYTIVIPPGLDIDWSSLRQYHDTGFVCSSLDGQVNHIFKRKNCTGNAGNSVMIEVQSFLMGTRKRGGVDHQLARCAEQARTLIMESRFQQARVDLRLRGKDLQCEWRKVLDTLFIFPVKVRTRCYLRSRAYRLMDPDYLDLATETQKLRLSMLLPATAWGPELVRQLFIAVQYKGLRAHHLQLLSTAQQLPGGVLRQRRKDNQYHAAFPEAQAVLDSMTLIDVLRSPRRLVNALAWYWTGELANTLHVMKVEQTGLPGGDRPCHPFPQREDRFNRTHDTFFTRVLPLLGTLEHCRYSGEMADRSTPVSSMWNPYTLPYQQELAATYQPPVFPSLPVYWTPVVGAWDSHPLHRWGEWAQAYQNLLGTYAYNPGQLPDRNQVLLRGYARSLAHTQRHGFEQLVDWLRALHTASTVQVGGLHLPGAVETLRERFALARLKIPAAAAEVQAFNRMCANDDLHQHVPQTTLPLLGQWMHWTSDWIESLL
jgi:uncharacterized protein (UPF0548 family)